MRTQRYLMNKKARKTAPPDLAFAERRLRTLVDISRAFSEEVELSSLLALVARRASEAIGAERTSVWLHDAERHELWTVVAEGELRELRMADDVGVAGWVMKRGEPVVVPDVSRDGRWNPELDKETGYITRNIMCVPMEDPHGERTGVFQCLNRAEGDLTDDDVKFLHAIASQAAIYIENARLLTARKEMFDSFVDTLAETIESRDPLTAGHSRNVMKYALGIAHELHLEAAYVEVIRYAALLHDYGKIGVPDEVLRKPSALTPEEYEVIKKHVTFTQQILARIQFEDRLRDVPVMAAHHHERIDGSGYPNGLAGEDISLGGKVIAVADAFDAMTSRRHYRVAMTVPEAVKIIEDSIGLQFDADVAAALKRYLVAEGRLEINTFD